MRQGFPISTSVAEQSEPRSKSHTSGITNSSRLWPSWLSLTWMDWITFGMVLWQVICPTSLKLILTKFS